MTDRDREALEWLAQVTEGTATLAEAMAPAWKGANAGAIRHALTLARRGAEASWRPMETAPKDAPILIFTPEEDVEIGGWGAGIWIAYHKGGDAGGYGLYPRTPTHWRPLPAPPEGEEGDHG